MTLLLSGCSEPGEEMYNQGVKSLNSGKPTEARQFFLQALDENPGIAEAYLNLGRIDIKHGTYANARENTLKALEMLKKERRTIISGATWQQQAALACNNLASIAFQEALEIKEDPQSAPKESARLFDEAKSWLAKAVEFDSENETILKNQKFIEKWEKSLTTDKKED
jgi:tetratricopeptide (TPR) repeat protein